MKVEFYQITDDPRTVEKNVTNKVHEVEVTLLESCSTHDPTFVLHYSPNLIHANYFKIVEWGSYYFMGDPVLSPGGRCLISGKEDVLMTYKDAILSLNAFCVRCESKFERYAVDPKVPSLVTSIVTNLQFSGHIFNANGSARQYLLTVKGGNVT